jgi:hypothetical protein
MQSSSRPTIGIGKRIKLVSIQTATLPKQLGGNRQIWVKWDRGQELAFQKLALIEGEDSFVVLD